MFENSFVIVLAIAMHTAILNNINETLFSANSMLYYD